MLGPDSRGSVETGLIDDRRVTHFWDEDRVVGRWLADTNVGGSARSSVVWDAYFLFGPNASWNERPAPVAGTGAPVISTTGSLERQLAPLLR